MWLATHNLCSILRQKLLLNSEQRAFFERRRTMGELAPILGGFGSTQGSASWLPPEVATRNGLYDRGRGPHLLFGRGTKGILAYPSKKNSGMGVGEGHAIVCAPSRSGKGIGFVIPNLLTWPGSVLCIDPKGENAHFTADRRRDFGPVYVVDPCRISGQQRASFNPLDWLRRSYELDEDLRLIVEALTPEHSGTGNDKFWNQGARDLLLGIIAFVLGSNDSRRSLGRVYDIVFSSEDDWEDTFDAMAVCNRGSQKLNMRSRNAANWYRSLHHEHQKYHRGTLQFHLGWLSVDSAREMLEASSFDMRDIKDGSASIYVCIPPLSLSTFEGFTRLITTLAIKAVMSRLAEPEEDPVLFMLDEFATTVGQMRAFEDAYTVISGYGGRFASIIQTIDQLQSLYPERRGRQSWKTVIENSGLQVYFNARKATAEFVSQQLGPTTVSQIAATGGPRQVQRPLLYPNEVSFPVMSDGTPVPDALFAFVEGLPPIRAKRLVSHRDPEFTALHNPKKALPRVIETGKTEYELAEMEAAPLDEKRMLPAHAPRLTEKDFQDLRQITAWDDWT